MKTTILFMLYYFNFFVSFFAQKLSEIENLRWLEGVWQCVELPQIELPQNYERWIWQNGSLSGISYQVVSGKEEVFEWLEITYSSGKLVYRVHIQNTGKKAEFVLERKGAKYAFINSQNDFPQMITYQRMNTKKFKVVLSMLRSDGKKSPTVLTFDTIP